MSRDEVRAAYPDGLRDIVGGGWMSVAPGETTDDTAMMLAIARACDEEGIDLELVALRFRTAPEKLVRAAIDTARITHADPRAAWGAVAVCQGIAHLLGGGSVDGVVEAATRGIPETSVVDAVTSAATRRYDEVRSGGYVLDTVNAAFWCLLHEPGAEDVIVRAVNMGDDADTTGIVAGALAGATYGIEGIPERWRAVVHHRAELEDLAGRLLALSEVGP